MVFYTHGHAPAVLASHSQRTARNSAAYLLESLHTGQELLDVGCGPATITADLARLVAPGRVVALDPAPAAREAARQTLAREGLAEAVEVIDGDALSLHLPTASFDVVHAHQVLQHLGDPVAGLREMRRVTRPGGIVAVRDSVYSAMCWYPEPAGMDLWRRMYVATARANGGEPDAGSRLVAWCRQAGFERIIPTASTWCYATPESRSWWSSTWAERTREALGPQAIAQDHATPEEVEEAALAWERWGADPDGWFVVVHGEALAVR